MKNNLSINESKVLEYLRQNEYLTTLEAVLKLKILHLGDVIYRLKRYGNNIDKMLVFENGKRYAKYYLIKS
jgi:hypothetical protein